MERRVRERGGFLKPKTVCGDDFFPRAIIIEDDDDEDDEDDEDEETLNHM